MVFINMAIIYKVKLEDMSLEAVIPVKDSIELYGIVSITTLSELDTMTLDILKDEYKFYDTYYERNTNVLSEIHTHPDEEVRLILAGIATFYIPDGDSLYIAECGPLDKVVLQPEVIHWFSKSGEVLAYRFFKDTESYTLQIPHNVPQLLSRARDFLHRTGKAFNI